MSGNSLQAQLKAKPEELYEMDTTNATHEEQERERDAAFEVLNLWVMYAVMLPVAVLVVVASWAGAI